MISPLVRRRRLAAEIRGLRDEAGLTAEGLGKLVGFHRLKISRIENAVGRPDPNDIMKLLDALGVKGERWHKLVEVADDAAERGWWERIRRDLGERQAVYVDLESGAETIREYENAVIPGLLQVRGYIEGRVTATIAMGMRVPDRSERQVDARLTRQRMLRRPDGPRYEAILEEVAVRRAAAPPDAMREQLRYLAGLASSDQQFSVRILPISARIPEFSVPMSPISVYTYPDSDDPKIVAVGTETEDTVLDDSDIVDHYVRRIDLLSSVALSKAESSALLRSLADNVCPQ